MKRGIAIAVVLGLAAGLATAQSNWYDDFDSYTLGDINGQGGWKWWDNDPLWSGAVVTNQYAHSPQQSVDVPTPADLVHEFSGYDSGQWTFTAWQYIPSDFWGSTYFILLNTYNDGGPYAWSVQVSFSNVDPGCPDCILHSFIPSPPLTIVYDQWIEIRVEIDLDTDGQAFYYNGDLLAEGLWTVQGGSSWLNIAAVDLYPDPGMSTTSVFYDDLSLVSAGGVTRGDLNCDGAIDSFDIDPFVLALTNPAGYQAQYPNCNIMNGDINCDGAVDSFDIDGFVECIVTGTCPPCP
jgi:hypothetical protein